MAGYRLRRPRTRERLASHGETRLDAGSGVVVPRTWRRAVIDRDRWLRVEALFAEAVLHPDHLRAEYLAEACGDDHELHAEIESLLQAHEHAAAFLESTAALERESEPVPAAYSLGPGTRLGAFEIVSPIGSGGMGAVYHARDTRLDRSVAVKVFAGRPGMREDARERLEGEARGSLASRILTSVFHHISSARVGDSEIQFLVMELLAGETLATEISRGPLPSDVAVQHALEIADALACAHRHGIVHRDLKPQNIMIRAAVSSCSILDSRRSRRPLPYRR